MSEFKKTLAGITKNLTKVSGELIKTTKINLAISGEEDNLKSVYIEIGKKVHEIYMFGGSIGKFFDEKYLEISEIEKKLAELREQLNIASGTKTCPKCNKGVEKFAEFCPKCGTRMNVDIRSDEPKLRLEPTAVPNPVIPETPVPAIPAAEPQEAPVLPVTRRCSACDAECDAADKFCLSCGRML